MLWRCSRRSFSPIMLCLLWMLAWSDLSGCAGCDDAAVQTFCDPNAVEVCGDLTDNNCDGQIDENSVLYYQDVDQDGYGDPATETDACESPGDGWVTQGGDCRDDDAAVHPDATEVCNEIDDDCDGSIDADDPDVVDAEEWYADSDGDGFGADAPILACVRPEGSSETADDCDDTDSGAYPGAAEQCDSVDNDCDGQIDEEVTTTYYTDLDHDGYGSSTSAVAACEAPSSDAVLEGGDCDDAEDAVHPGATETCNGQDDDCDGLSDDADPEVVGGSTWYLDQDSDGFGSSTQSTGACVQPDGYSDNASDCDDGDALTYPDALETCDGKDNDCDGETDEGVLTTYYQDADSDGYGTSYFSQDACTAPTGYVADSGDCDDLSASIHPGSEETCNDADDDCDGEIDDGLSLLAVAGGGRHSLALCSDGTVVAWGDNENGQLGDGTDEERHTPVQTLDLDEVVAIAAGDCHSLALRADGTVWSWGCNESGQLGDASYEDRYLPVQVGSISSIVQIACGYEHSLAVTSTGTVWAWGLNEDGQLGNGSANETQYLPVQVADLSSVLTVAAGESHSIALRSNGSLRAWGSNSTGQLGDGTKDDRAMPVDVVVLTSQVTAIAAGTDFSLAVKSDGTAWSWGNNGNGQLGDGTTSNRTSPVQITALSGMIAVAGGNRHSLGLDDNGAVWAWGYNSNGELGDGSTSNRKTPVQVQGLFEGIDAIEAGYAHSLALQPPAPVWAWGNNANGELGNGTTTDQHTPIAVPNLP